jgi:hypothetical protein
MGIFFVTFSIFSDALAFICILVPLYVCVNSYFVGPRRVLHWLTASSLAAGTAAGPLFDYLRWW